MSDHCFMQITCRRQDLPLFEPLGFHLEFEQAPESPIVELIDQEANYAHHGKLPTAVPFLASHGPGGDYGAGEIACDGIHHAEVEVGHGCGYVVRWDDTTNQPSPECLDHIRDYLAIQHTVQQRFQALAATSTQG